MIIKLKDVMHYVSVKFAQTFLPNAKKAYYLKAVHQPELDIKGIAAKAVSYNMTTNPKQIEEGLTAAIELIYYLVADGFRIKTPLFNLKLSFPGLYSGYETSLHEDTYPVIKIYPSAEFRKYIKEKVKVEFDGKDDSVGFIAEAIDEATGSVSEIMTKGNILKIIGAGIKIDTDEEHKDLVGVFFKPKTGVPVKANVIAVNENRTLKVLVPDELSVGTSYQIAVETMSSVRGGNYLVKKVRDLRSDFTLTAA